MHGANGFDVLEFRQCQRFSLIIVFIEGNAGYTVLDTEGTDADGLHLGVFRHIPGNADGVQPGNGNSAEEAQYHHRQLQKPFLTEHFHPFFQEHTAGEEAHDQTNHQKGISKFTAEQLCDQVEDRADRQGIQHQKHRGNRL